MKWRGALAACFVVQRNILRNRCSADNAAFVGAVPRGIVALRGNTGWDDDFVQKLFGVTITLPAVVADKEVELTVVYLCSRISRAKNQS